MKRRGFLTTLLGAPVAAKAAGTEALNKKSIYDKAAETSMALAQQCSLSIEDAINKLSDSKRPIKADKPNDFLRGAVENWVDMGGNDSIIDNGGVSIYQRPPDGYEEIYVKDSSEVARVLVDIKNNNPAVYVKWMKE